ncbi:hypothetical protein KM043_016429 [Ampulex compressa]|nr:hypothetical protein KM043_016429 [Ampulex compressa]
MSGSEEEFEPQSQHGMTKAELRRSNKPIMEKRRRARINQCLDELKSLILEAMKKDPTRHSKLEKADILEMTVKHLQTVQRQQLSTAVATDPAVLTKFRTGFSECATEVSRNLQQMAPFYSHYVPYMPERLYPEVKVGFQSDFQNGDENNNGSARIQIPNGVQLIPSRLPTGELALLVPQSAGISANFPFFPPAPESSSRIGQPSAFTAVHRPHSPMLSPSTSTSSYEESHHSEHYPQAQSPPHSNAQSRFKVPEQGAKSASSSPETQKPQISSSSDRKSPVPVFVEPKVDTRGGVKKDSLEVEPSICSVTSQSLRQPLSVITDKAYNRAPAATKREGGLKRHHSDGLLVISDKRPRYQEPTSSSTAANSSGLLGSREEHAASVEDLSGGATCSTARNSNSNAIKFPAGSAGPSAANGDMWRPW